MLGAVVVGVSTANRWLIVLAIVAILVLIGGSIFRHYARGGSTRRERRQPAKERDTPTIRGFRRRGGALLAIGPIVGLVFAPSPDGRTIVLVAVAVALAGVGAYLERSPRADQLTFLASALAALAAVLAGVRFEPTGVGALDVVLGFGFVLVITQAIDGLGNVDGLVSGMGAAAAASVFGIAAFGFQYDLASVALGLAAACFAFLAFNFPPASLFVGRAGRLTVGYVLAVGALSAAPVPGPGRSLVTPLILVGVLLLDVVVVATDRLRRRRPLTVHRSDHLVHRLAALGWTPTEAMLLLVATQVLLALVALFTARAVLPLWLGASIAAVVIFLLGVEVARGRLEHEAPRGLPVWVWIGIGGAVVLVALAIVPTAIAANDSAGLMVDGRDAASRGLAAARDGDTITARGAFNEAARTFAAARDKLESPLLSGSLAIPGVASNVRAARALASIGADLARAGEDVTTAVDPDALSVVEGRLPVEEVVKVTPVLERGSEALTSALAELDDIRDDPYLAGPIEDAVDKIHAQLAQAEREARHAADAAKLAPALFGADGPRRYLLVVQNNAESRATGGFIGSFGTITADNGKLTVSPIERTGVWNAALRSLGTVTYDAPTSYRSRYTQFRPDTTLQNVNLSPDFPSVAKVLESLAPQAGVGPVDGVISVDPAGLSALLSLTGPVSVPQWPTEITAENVVGVTLSDAYAVYPEETADRVDFLGDVAHAAVDAATSGSLGKPASIAKALGAASHEGHLTLAFTRPEEQTLAEQLDVAEHVRPVRSDALAVTTSNFGGNKIDYYLQRSIDYRVKLQPDAATDAASATGSLKVSLSNTAPSRGLPQIVIGPFDDRFTAGENRLLLSTYSPLGFESATWDDQPTAVSPARELDRNVYAVVRDIPAQTTGTLDAQLAGDVKLHDGWYTLEVRHQPTLNPDRIRVSVEVPAGWTIDRAPGMERPFAQRAVKMVELNRTTRFRVHLTQSPGMWDLWGRLEAGK